jgi:hypothetical protein
MSHACSRRVLSRPLPKSGRQPKPASSKGGETFRLMTRCGETNEGVRSMTNPNHESLVVEFKKEVAKMREREATDLEIQSMLEFVEQLTHWRGDVDREPLINALRDAIRR